MSKITLNIPGLTGQPANIPNPPGVKGEFKDLGSLVSGGLNLAFIIAGFLMLIWLSWGVLQYIFAGGNKQSLENARKRMMWAIIGFLIIILAFMISQYAKTIFNPNSTYKNFNKTQPITPPVIGPLPSTY